MPTKGIVVNLQRMKEALRYYPSNILVLWNISVRAVARLVAWGAYDLFWTRYKIPNEPFLLTYLKGKHEDSMDIGAYVGSHTRFLARFSKRVVAVEPDPQNFKELCGRLADLRGKVIPLNVACSEGDGSAILYRSREKSQHSLIRTNAFTEGKVEVTTKSVDSIVSMFALGRSLIRIDTEGAEHLVLRGARKTLEKFHPGLLIEYHNNRREVVGELKQMGYCSKMIRACSPTRGYLFAFKHGQEDTKQRVSRHD